MHGELGGRVGSLICVESREAVSNYVVPSWSGLRSLCELSECCAMGWSSRQVWGFTGLMVGVIVMTLVGMVTVVLIMVTGSPPQGSLLGNDLI